MDITQTLLLGVLQGITEFLPISSSGHLVLFRDAFGLPLEGSLAFDSVLHLATALAVLIYFRRDVLQLIRSAYTAVCGRGRNEHSALVSALIVGTIPAAVVGFFYADRIEEFLRSPVTVVIGLIVGTVLLLCAEFFLRRKKNSAHEHTITTQKGLYIGLFQVLALIAGVSRSGAVISGGVFMGLTREAATRFAFLLAIPVLLGAGFKGVFDVASTGFLATIGTPLLISSLVAFVVGMLAIHFMLKLVRTHSLYPFIVYRLLLILVVIFFLVASG